jgi:hypothetical protein
MAANGLVTADTVLDPGEEEVRRNGMKTMQMAIPIVRSCSAIMRKQHLRVARLAATMMQVQM